MALSGAWSAGVRRSSAGWRGGSARRGGGPTSGHQRWGTPRHGPRKQKPEAGPCAARRDGRAGGAGALLGVRRGRALGPGGRRAVEAVGRWQERGGAVQLTQGSGAEVGWTAPGTRAGAGVAGAVGLPGGRVDWGRPGAEKRRGGGPRRAGRAGA